jgi:hypothetical protein
MTNTLQGGLFLRFEDVDMFDFDISDELDFHLRFFNFSYWPLVSACEVYVFGGVECSGISYDCRGDLAEPL